MISPSLRSYLFFALGLLSFSLQSFFDSRDLAQSFHKDIWRPYARGRSFWVSSQPFIMRADRSFEGLEYTHHHSPLFGQYGPLSLKVLNKALLDTQLITQSILRPDFATGIDPLDFSLQGRLEVVGCALHAGFSPYKGIEIGAKTALMHAMTITEATPAALVGDDTLYYRYPLFEYGDWQELKANQATMQHIVGLAESGLWTKKGFSDLDVYVRAFTEVDYRLRCKRIRSSAVFGVLFPTSPKRDARYLSSIPFDGNGHWGVYGAGNVDFVLKENITFGARLKLQQRMRHTFYDQPVPLEKENPLFGVTRADLWVNPGITIGFTPHLMLEALRGGFGARVGYSIIGHTQDDVNVIHWVSASQGSTEKIESGSSWVSEHLTVSLFYDGVRSGWSFLSGDVFLSLDLDIPFHGLAKSRRAKSCHAWSLGVHIDF